MIHRYTLITVLISSLSSPQLGKQLDSVHVITQSIQVIPVSVATVLQQEPFMLFYQQQEGAAIPPLPLGYYVYVQCVYMYMRMHALSSMSYVHL